MLSPSLFHSRIARRMFALFVLCTLTPTSILGWISYRQVTEQLILQTSARLKQESKSQGMVLYNYLLTLTADLDRIAAELPHDSTATEGTTITTSMKEFGRRFQDIRFLTPSNPDRRQLTPAQIAHLQEGKTLLEIESSPNHRPQLTLTRLVNRDRWEAGLLSAHVDDTALWSTQVKDALPGDTDLVVEDGERHPLYSTFSDPIILPNFRRHDTVAPMGDGAIWKLGQQEYVAGAWSMPLRHMFLIEPWVIVLNQTRESALAPVEQFRHTFVLVIASALSAVVLLSLAQIRRSLHPVAVLQDGTARLAAGNFSTHVTVTSRDEFQDLATSFNRMTDQLSQQFHMLETISAISQAILSSHEPAAMVKILQSRITETIACDAVGTALSDAAHPDSMVMSVRFINSRSDHESKTYPCRFSDEHLADMKIHSNYMMTAPSTLPSYLTPMLKPDLSLFVIFPIFVHELVSGVLVLAYRQRTKPPADDLAHGRRLADQVAVALANSHAIKAQVQAQIELAGAVDAKDQAEEQATILQATNQLLETKEERLRHQQSATLTLVQDRTVFQGSLPITAKQVTTIAAEALVVPHVSIWIFEELTQALYCLDSFDRLANTHSFGAKLIGTQYPKYFEALRSGRLIIGTQALQNQHFSELIAGARSPQQIGARIDAPFHTQGKLTGVVSIEHVGSSRDWASDEQQFAQALANFMALVLEAARRRESEEALAIATRTAEEATKAKAEFLANMSHEIRTPMNGVIGMTEILARTPLSDTQRHYVETIHHSSDTLLTLINDILDFSKIEAGKLDIQSVPIDLRDIVERTVEQLAERAQRKRLNLSVQYDPALPTTVVGDPIRIRQILTNLLSNAIKFTQAGDVCVAVALDPSPSDEGTPWKIRLTVTDTGSGISAEGKAKLFQSFSQVDGSSTRVHGGTGLGLSICKQLSELMGGVIGVESLIGRGSTFWVVLPFPLQPGTVVESQADPSLADVRVCVAVSHPETRQVLSRYLSSWGISARLADTETEFLEQVMTELATEGTRVVVLVDETFVNMTDIDVLHTLNSDSSLQSAKIVRLVSFIRRAEAEQDPTFGRIQVVTKPLYYQALRRAILDVLTEHPVTVPHTSLLTETATLSGHLLLGEDNPVNQEIAILMLQDFGCTVTVAQNGREVCDRIKQTSFDLILMDCQMPEMDGFEATRLIREWETAESRPAIPIIALTAHATPGDREQCLSAGMSDYISKPFSMERLHAVLTRWLQPALTTSKVEQSAPTPTLTLIPATQAPAAEESLIVDVAAWKAITSLQRPGKEDVLVKILSLYLADSQALVDTLQQGMAAGDAQVVNQAAHSLKSRSAVLGALSLAELCQQFETLSRESRLSEAQPLRGQLDAAFDHASRIFHAELERRAA